MPKSAENNSSGDTKAQTLRVHNPYVEGLGARQGVRRDNFQLFDGKSKLIVVPMTDYDGYPLESEYVFFVPAILTVIASALIPLIPFFWAASFAKIAIIAVAYLVAVVILSVRLAFHLTAIRTTYISANSNILATDFVTRARGVRSLIHTFKCIVRWRRFMRYTMNFGYAILLLTAMGEVYGFFHSAFDAMSATKTVTAFVVLTAVSALSLTTFEFGRKLFTEGMDPTLALIQMIEEIGGQLLASRQTNLVGTGGE